MDNHEVAILSKVNAIAGRVGLGAQDFKAWVSELQGSGPKRWELRLVRPSEPDLAEKFTRLVQAIGAKQDSGVLGVFAEKSFFDVVGTAEEILGRLDVAT